jgi:molybdopterin molybdotransferase/putative molybdopterin biosynthesis protein
MADQQQFLDVIDRDEAERRFQAAISLAPLAAETIPLAAALGRVLADNMHSPVDVPSFDRANVDGYALRAADTFGASEQKPRRAELLAQSIPAAIVPPSQLQPGQAIAIATGGMLPRGADAVLMVEHSDAMGNELLIRRPITPGANVTFAGTDIAAGELVLHVGKTLTSRETGVLAAIGVSQVLVVRRPRVAIISTGDEIIAPGQPMRPAWFMTATPESFPTRCASWEANRSSWELSATMRRSCEIDCRKQLPTATWYYSQEAQARVRATFVTTWSASFATLESSRTESP